MSQGYVQRGGYTMGPGVPPPPLVLTPRGIHQNMYWQAGGRSMHPTRMLSCGI